MATVYVVHEFTDAHGTHAVGDELNMPEDNEAQTHELERMINYGLVSRSRPATNQATGTSSTTAASSSPSSDDGEGGSNGTRSKTTKRSSS